MADLAVARSDSFARRRRPADGEQQADELAGDAAVSAMHDADDDLLTDVAPLREADRPALDARLERDRLLVHVAMERWNSGFDSQRFGRRVVNRHDADASQTLPECVGLGRLDENIEAGFARVRHPGHD